MDRNSDAGCTLSDLRSGNESNQRLESSNLNKPTKTCGGGPSRGIFSIISLITNRPRRSCSVLPATIGGGYLYKRQVTEHV